MNRRAILHWACVPVKWSVRKTDLIVMCRIKFTSQVFRIFMKLNRSAGSVSRRTIPHPRCKTVIQHNQHHVWSIRQDADPNHRTMKCFKIILLSIFCINCTSQQYSKSWIDLNYADDTMKYHRLDIYLPQVKKPTYPVVFLIYGSAWFGNDRKGNDLNTIGKALLDAGFAVVTPNHRSSKDAIFPAQIHDVKAAVRFVRANAKDYQIDTSFIGITGSSS